MLPVAVGLVLLEIGKFCTQAAILNRHTVGRSQDLLSLGAGKPAYLNLHVVRIILQINAATSLKEIELLFTYT